MAKQPKEAQMAELRSACPRRVLLVRLDAIGDYVLFRNVLRFIRHSAAYRDAHITMLGNPSWRNLAETFDGDCVDEWIWVERRGDLFRKSLENLVPATVWHRRVAKSQGAFREPLLQRHFDEVLSLQPIRDPLLDELVAGLAPSVVGIKGPGGDDSAYTRLLDPGHDPFVFLRNRRAAADLTGESCDVSLALDVPHSGVTAPRLMLFPGASHWTKRWPLSRFAAAGRRFLANGGNMVCVAGGPADAARIRALARRIGNPERVAMWNVRRPLANLAVEMAACSAVVSNDTMALHLAAAIGTPAVGVVNGITGRDDFWPYPESLGKRVAICGADGAALMAELVRPVSQSASSRSTAPSSPPRSTKSATPLPPSARPARMSAVMPTSSTPAPICSRATEFAVFCIENTAERLGRTGSDVYNGIASADGIDKFLYPSYEMLHTQSRDYIVDETIGWLHEHVPAFLEDPK